MCADTSAIENAIINAGGRFDPIDYESFYIVFDQKVLSPSVFYNLLSAHLPYECVTKEFRESNGLSRIYVLIGHSDDPSYYYEDDEDDDDDGDNDEYSFDDSDYREEDEED